MNSTIPDRIAIVTGAGGGIGRATAVELAREGFAIALVDLDLAAAEATADRARSEVPEAIVACFAADVSRAVDVEKYVDEVVRSMGPPVLLVNCAGVEGRVRAIHEYSESEFDSVWATNARGAWLNIKFVVPHMLEQERGAIVNVASVAAIRSSPLLAPYVASKHALLGLTRSAASDLAAAGIRVNAVCPGPVDTRMMATLNEQRAGSADKLDGGRSKMASRVALGRFAEPYEIAAVIAFLASDKASFVTGATIVADGGMTM